MSGEQKTTHAMGLVWGINRVNLSDLLIQQVIPNLHRIEKTSKVTEIMVPCCKSIKMEQFPDTLSLTSVNGDCAVTRTIISLAEHFWGNCYAFGEGCLTLSYFKSQIYGLPSDTTAKGVVPLSGDHKFKSWYCHSHPSGFCTPQWNDGTSLSHLSIQVTLANHKCLSAHV